MAFREVTLQEVKEVVRLWRARVPKKRIAAQPGLDIKTVRRYLKALEEGAAEPEPDLDTATGAIHPRQHQGEHERRGNAFSPLGHTWIGFARSRFAQLRHDVGVEDEHQSKSAGSARSRLDVASKTMSPIPVGCESISMMPGWLAERRW